MRILEKLAWGALLFSFIEHVVSALGTKTGEIIAERIGDATKKKQEDSEDAS